MGNTKFLKISKPHLHLIEGLPVYRILGSKYFLLRILKTMPHCIITLGELLGELTFSDSFFFGGGPSENFIEVSTVQWVWSQTAWFGNLSLPLTSYTILGNSLIHSALRSSFIKTVKYYDFPQESLRLNVLKVPLLCVSTAMMIMMRILKSSLCFQLPEIS